MPAKKVIALSLIFAGVGILIGFFVIRLVQSRNPTAGLKIDTSPQSLVFVNGVEIGKTPIDKFFPPGEVTIKLVPNSSSSALASYQAKLRLTNKVYTAIKRDFGTDENSSSGDIITLQPQSEPGSGLNVLTSGPESAAVTLDNQPQGFTPLSVSSLSPGTHQILVSAPGYQSRLVPAQAISGYKLVVNVKLSSLGASVSPTPQPSPLPTQGTPAPTSKITPKATPRITIVPTVSLPKPYVTVKNTPTGFLRVRDNPSLGGKEVGQVNPGESFPLIGSKSGWYQIQADLPATSSGWISSQYATKFE